MVFCKEDSKGGWQDESKFFENHLGFRGVKSEVVGTERLGGALGEIIKEKLFDELGMYMKSVERRLQDVEEELRRGVGGGKGVTNLQQAFVKVSE